MERIELQQKFKLAALDLDGTLLGPSGQISPENALAVQRMQSVGLQIVLASGRHYNNIRSYAEKLSGVEWIVSCQGGEAADINREVILQREFLPANEAKLGLEIGRTLGFTAIAYGIDGVFTDSEWNADIAFYTELSGRRPTRLSSQQFLEGSIFKVIWIAEPREIEKAVDHTSRITQIQTVRTHERLLEIMPLGVTKASALNVISKSLGIKASETIVFGDGDNDVPMFEWAGASVAMAHGWPAAIQTATYTTHHGALDTALSRGVDLAFANGLFAPLSLRQAPGDFRSNRGFNIAQTAWH